MGHDVGDGPTTEREAIALWCPGAAGPIEAAGATHPGRLRAQNEDAFEIATELGLATVADGLGGHAAGDIASRMAVQEVTDQMRDLDPDPTLPDASDLDALPRGALELLRLSVQRANRAIHAGGLRFPVCAGMGTTVAAALIVRGFAVIAHVGDSRIYRLRAGKLVQLTEDDSLAAQYARAFGAAADPMMLVRHAGTLTRCLGAWPEVKISVRAERRLPGDRYLLCTDGLWNTLSHSTMTRIVSETADLQLACSRLVDAANAAGGPDNITAVLVKATSD